MIEQLLKKISGSKFTFVLLLLIFASAFLVRTYRITNPIADWHSWRQTDTSAVSRIFAEKGFDILHPRYLDISNIQTGKNNPEGYRFVEFPLYNIAVAGLYKIVGLFPIEVWGRLITIFASLMSGLFLFLFTFKHFNKGTAYFSLLFYLFLPYSIYYGRVVLPDTSMVAATLGGIYFFDLYLNHKSKKKYLFLLVSTLFTASSFLLKPYALIFALPQIILAWEKYRARVFLRAELWMHLILSVMPLVLWRVWIGNFPEGVPASAWLFNGNGIRFRPAFFRWIFYERLTKLIGGYVGVIFGITGVGAVLLVKKKLIALSFLAASLLYLFIFATGNVQHDYYQILIMPTVALFFAFGANFFWQKKNRAYKVGVILLFVISIYFSWQQVKDYFNINNIALVEAGKRADAILPKDAKVIAPFDGDTTLLYYINRKGWPAFQDSIEKLIQLGATNMVIVNPSVNDFKGFGTEFKIVDSSSKYLILDLRK